MAGTVSKWIEAISVLTDLTQRGTLKWEVDTLPRPFHSGGLISGAMTFGIKADALAAYKAPYRNAWIRLVRRDVVQQDSKFTFGTTPPMFELLIVDASGAILYEIPESKGLGDLYQAVQRQLSGVDAILQALLDERQNLK